MKTHAVLKRKKPQPIPLNLEFATMYDSAKTSFFPLCPYNKKLGGASAKTDDPNDQRPSKHCAQQ